MHAVGDVVRQVHDLALDRPRSLGSALLEPFEHSPVIRVDAEFRAAFPFGMLGGLGVGPRVFDGGVKRRTCQIHSGGAPVGKQYFRFEPGEQSQGLRIAFETADMFRDFSKHTLSVVSERRVAEIVRETGAVDHIRITAEGGANLTANLRNLQCVRESGSYEIVGTGHQHLTFRAEPTERRRVNQPGPITLEGGARTGFRRFRGPPFFIERRVTNRHGHLRSAHPGRPEGQPLPPAGARLAPIVPTNQVLYRILFESSLARSSADSTSVACSYRRGMRLRRQVKIS